LPKLGDFPVPITVVLAAIITPLLVLRTGNWFVPERQRGHRARPSSRTTQVSHLWSSGS
jgi:hypothetical protein